MQEPLGARLPRHSSGANLPGVRGWQIIARRDGQASAVVVPHRGAFRACRDGSRTAERAIGTPLRQIHLPGSS